MLSWAGVGGSLAGCWRSFGTVGTVGVFDTVGKFNYALAVTWERVFMRCLACRATPQGTQRQNHQVTQLPRHFYPYKL